MNSSSSVKSVSGLPSSTPSATSLALSTTGSNRTASAVALKGRAG